MAMNARVSTLHSLLFPPLVFLNREQVMVSICNGSTPSIGTFVIAFRLFPSIVQSFIILISPSCQKSHVITKPHALQSPTHQFLRSRGINEGCLGPQNSVPK